ncbi:MAG: hypothetical protein E6677_06045 [Finegoldia magna]|nr:hypothetical protein [Finegoldia magna]
MFNDEYSLELYKIVREDEDMYYRDFVDFIAKTKVSKAIYHGEPIPMTYQGLFYNKKNRSDFVYISNISLECINCDLNDPTMKNALSMYASKNGLI